MVSDTNGKHISVVFIQSPESNSFTLVPNAHGDGYYRGRLHCS